MTEGPKENETHHHYHGQQDWADSLGLALVLCVLISAVVIAFSRHQYFEYQLQLNGTEVEDVK